MLKKIFHPVLIFILLQVAWSGFLSLWITWYVLNKLKINALTRQLGLPEVRGDWFILVGGSMLMFVIMIGITLLFVYQVRESRLNRLQQDFVSTITHELKTPLASIQLYTETMFLRDIPQNDRSEFLGFMLRESARLSHLIDNLLVASRIRGSRLILNPGPTDIFLFIQNFFAKNSQRLGWDNQVITLDGSPGQQLMLDEQYMDIALTNIVTNAIKYSGGDFKLAVKIRTADGRTSIDFTDQGLGIKSGELKKMFKIFFRSPAIRETGIQGTGLGLFIVREITRAMGGKVKASCAGPGQGMTISLNLPNAAGAGQYTAHESV